MSAQLPQNIILANDADGPKGATTMLRLHYMQGHGDHIVHIGLPRFVQDVYHLRDRVLDLLEIAGYVFAADRCISRGPKIAVEYQAWSRSLQFHIRVRDYEFWSRPPVREVLSRALEFMTGDSAYNFEFEAGHSTPPTSLFDRPGFTVDPGEGGVQVTLFSGGLDSLCGALDLLKSSDISKVILVSHQSQTGTIHTQRSLVDALQRGYPGRVFHYRFECTLRGIRAREETQRTRSFLYTSIAYAIASAYGQDDFHVYENGVTSINLRRREDLANARASRTTHPQTMARMAHLFSMIAGKQVTIQLPFLYQTKTDVISKLLKQSPELISSAVSCSRTFQTEGQATHCGRCFQCIDRRLAVHAANAEHLDHRGLYTHDVLAGEVKDREAKTTLVDYLRQAVFLAENPVASFEDEYLAELAELFDFTGVGSTDGEKVHALWNLFHRHGTQVKSAISKIRQLYDDLSQSLPAHSLLHIVASREYLKPEQARLADSIATLISPALGDMFARNKPKDEPDLNSKLGALLRTHDARLQSEHPTISFACARVVPDHTWPDNGVLVEAKYVRKGTSPSQATEGIAADLTKYPQNAFILFVVYDPHHRVASDDNFRGEIEAKGRNRVLILR
jgi:7-cyano-7-deazaguanine synthase in queuosine biosynthesis